MMESGTDELSTQLFSLLAEMNEPPTFIWTDRVAFITSSGDHLVWSHRYNRLSFHCGKICIILGQEIDDDKVSLN